MAVTTAISMIYVGSTWAQVCSGSLGDPVINITFGAGTTNIGPPLDPGTTNYPFVNYDFPQDGLYTIESTTAGIGRNDKGDLIWWPTTDHTGDKGGYMMVINATLSPTDYFYKHIVSGLCPGTTYEFAAWIVNLLPYKDISPPNIVFSISNTNGSVIGSYTTGQIPINKKGPEWIQYKLIFTTPPGISSVELKIRDISAGGGPANDLALDDITFRACGPLITSGFTGNNSGVALSDCLGNNNTYAITADVSAQSYADPAYQWQIKVDSGWKNIAGETRLGTIQVKEPDMPGKYAYRMVSAEQANINIPSCRVASNPVLLNIVAIGITAPPVINLTEGKSVIIQTVSTGNKLHFKWTPSLSLDNDTAASPKTSAVNDTRYRVIATSSEGCSSEADVYVMVLKKPFIPNSFTPNGDGINDTWDIGNIFNRPGYSVKVFNRYGEVVFSSAGYTVPWNGTYRGRKLPPGVYYYVFETHNEIGLLSGNVTILY